MEVLAPVRRLRARRELVAARRIADAELLGTALPSPRFAWRTNELCSDEYRRALAESVVQVVKTSETRYLPSTSPLNRVAAREQLAPLLQVAAVLADVERRVAPRGVLLVQRLLTGSKSPLYQQGTTNELRAALTDALNALEGRR